MENLPSVRPGDIADQIVSDVIDSIMQRRPVGIVGALVVVGIVAVIRKGFALAKRRDHMVNIYDEYE